MLKTACRAGSRAQRLRSCFKAYSNAENLMGETVHSKVTKPVPNLRRGFPTRYGENQVYYYASVRIDWHVRLNPIAATYGAPY
jgi:hypothetical protein